MTKKIFLIEDDPSLSKIYNARLGKEGYAVFLAAEGFEGLRRVGEEEPDLVILDLILPGMSGFEILRQLKSDPKTKHIPVLVLTILEQDEDVKEALRLGASGYLFKSDTGTDDLVAQVKKHLLG